MKFSKFYFICQHPFPEIMFVCLSSLSLLAAANPYSYNTCLYYPCGCCSLQNINAVLNQFSLADLPFFTSEALYLVACNLGENKAATGSKMHDKLMPYQQ